MLKDPRFRRPNALYRSLIADRIEAFRKEHPDFPEDITCTAIHIRRGGEIMAMRVRACVCGLFPYGLSMLGVCACVCLQTAYSVY